MENNYNDLLIAIKKLSVFYSIDQAVDVLDIYFKTNDEGCLPVTEGIRDYIKNSNLREKIFPLVDGKYNHLMDFINDTNILNDEFFDKKMNM